MGNGQLECKVVATSRVYDPEAEDVFGQGYLSLQVEIVQLVAVESDSMSSVTLQLIIESGFDVVTGGQSQFRRLLHDNPVFLTIISVKVRRGFSSSGTPPSMAPTTDEQPHSPSWFPSFRPSMVLEDVPSEGPSTELSTFPSSTSPSIQSSTSPESVTQSLMPSLLTLSESPTSFFSELPSLAQNPSTEQSTPVPDMPTQSSAVDRQKLDGTAAAAAVAGTTAAFLAFFLCICTCVLCRHRRINSKKSCARKGDDHELNAIPDIVRLQSDQRSWAESTMGEYITYGWICNAKRTLVSKGAPHPLGSFDENSLYTSPYIARDEEDYHSTTILPVPTASSLSSEGPDEHFKSFRGSTDVQPYQELTITKIEPLDPVLNAFQQNGDFTTDPIEIGVWSSDFEDSDDGCGDYTTEAYSKVTSSSLCKDTAHKKRTARSSSRGLAPHTSYLVDRRVTTLEHNEDWDHLSVRVAPSPMLEPCSNGRSLADTKIEPKKNPNKMVLSYASGKAVSSTETASFFYSPKATDHHAVDGSPGPASNLLHGNIVNPMAHVFESKSIPAVKPEENESDCSTGLGAAKNRKNETRVRDRALRQGKDVDNDEISESETSGLSNSTWLLEVVASTLGQSKNPDMESLSVKSNRSNQSMKNRAPGARRIGSDASFESCGQILNRNVTSLISVSPSSLPQDALPPNGRDVCFKTPRSALEYELRRLEKQLAAVDRDNITTTSSISMSNVAGSDFQQPLQSGEK